MYMFRIWFEHERWAIAKEEIDALRADTVAQYPSYLHDTVNRALDRAIPIVAHNIHPLCLLGLRPKIHLTTD